MGYDGSPVTKVEITSNGPKPTVRWIAKPKVELMKVEMENGRLKPIIKWVAKPKVEGK